MTLKAGHQFRDKDGNLVATLNTDLQTGMPLSAKYFTLPDGSHPEAGTRIPQAIADELDRLTPVGA